MPEKFIAMIKTMLLVLQMKMILTEWSKRDIAGQKWKKIRSNYKYRSIN
jgi:hypothetical protein